MIEWWVDGEASVEADLVAEGASGELFVPPVWWRCDEQGAPSSSADGATPDALRVGASEVWVEEGRRVKIHG